MIWPNNLFTLGTRLYQKHKFLNLEVTAVQQDDRPMLDTWRGTVFGSQILLLPQQVQQIVSKVSF